MSLLNKVDAIVMLTWSDWFNELRSNRYHYATRFAKIKPVIFVQPDLEESSYFFEETGIENIVILHLSKIYDDKQKKLLNAALVQRNCIRPLFWIYNCYFHNFLIQRYSVLNIYHGTEDYLASESRIKFQDNVLINAYLKTLSTCHLIIAVSDGVKKSFESNIDFEGNIHTIYNGCDYSFYSPKNNQANENALNSKIAFYQGNIFDKLDYDLLLELTKIMPDWTFNFCGKVLFNEEKWQQLCEQPNVNYLGLLTPEEVRAQSYLSTVGLIPFVQTEWLIVRSFPLKTFEYLASGLPVVSIPIESILNYSDVIQFADTAEKFAVQIKLAASLRWNQKHMEKRLQVASQQDYNIRFQELVRHMERPLLCQKNTQAKLLIGILYDSSSTSVRTIEEHLKSFALFSQHRISYIPSTQTQDILFTHNLDVFDVLVIHYSVRISVLNGNFMLTAEYIDAVKSFGGYKILFIQDEYEGTNIAHYWIKALGIHVVYTCVPQQYKEMVYPTEKFPYVNFISSLTGYVPIEKTIHKKFNAHTDRKILIGYRGRSLPYWYGTLGQEKLNIGIKVKEYCLSKKLPVDIEWEESKRIYGEDWYYFLTNCRATLGTESGSNVFDFDGSIRADIEKELTENPQLSFEDIYETHIKPNEKIRMNQVSPKIFEAIIFKTALILFEGEYSGILTPHVHYIPLKKNFSNLSEVIEKVQNDKLVDEIIQNAYDDIILSNKYSYREFITDFDEMLRCLTEKRRMGNQPMCFGDLPENKIIDEKIQIAILPSLVNKIDKHTQIQLLPIVKKLIKYKIKKIILVIIGFKPMQIAIKFIPKPVKKIVKQLVLQ